LLYNYESLMESSVVELIREEAGAFYEDLSYLDGGMDQLPRALASRLTAEVRFGARVTAIACDESGVRVICRDTAGNVDVAASADYAIVTLPLPVLRFIDFTPRLPVAHSAAIRQLHYDAATKVFLQVRERFWERLPPNLQGGQVSTDRPVRNIYYPPHGEETGRGVVLASYTWGDDAEGWASLAPNNRLAEATEQLREVHDGIPGLGDVGALVEGGASKSWHDDEFAGGAYALFDPGQAALVETLRAPVAGRVFFAGEHLSTKHAWIQGSIESAIQAAFDVHRAAAASS
jgi:monoamine oxidase